MECVMTTTKRCENNNGGCLNVFLFIIDIVTYRPAARQENPGTGNIRGLNLAADKPTNVQVSNCRFLGLNKLRHKLLHYSALTDVSVCSRT
jgi:hypothetical protein